MDGKLDVRAACGHADGTDDGEAGVAHPLILSIGERHRRGDGDRVAGVDATGIEVLDRADDDGVVVGVAHHLHLVFLPSEDRFLDEHLPHWRQIDAALHLRVELVAVVGDPGAGAAKGEARADDRRQADLGEHLAGLRERPHDPAAAGLEADLPHRLLEDLPVLAPFDGVGLGPDHLHPVPGENTVAVELHGEVERRLAAERGEDRVGLLDFNDLLEHLPGERLDVGPVGRVRIGHDRGRVGIDEDDAVAILAQRLAGLGTGVVELTGLADDDRPGADEEDRVEVVSAGHGGIRARRRSKGAGGNG